MKGWLQFFRVVNLPSAPGDVLAGAAFFAGDANLAEIMVAAWTALGVYMFGLADNDITGLERDRATAPERPLVRGEISPGAAKAARAACLALAFLPAAWWTLRGGGMCAAWWALAALQVGCVVSYNRFKDRARSLRLWLMGACRGLSVLLGAAAALGAAGWSPRTAAVAAAMAAGWTAYIAAVTFLAEGEDAPSEGLGNRRYALGAVALAPALACFVAENVFQAALPLFGCAAAFAAWCAAVGPLWAPHGPAERKRAVGRAIGALMYLQTGFMLAAEPRAVLFAAVALWFAARFVRRAARGVSGS